MTTAGLVLMPAGGDQTCMTLLFCLPFLHQNQIRQVCTWHERHQSRLKWAFGSAASAVIAACARRAHGVRQSESWCIFAFGVCLNFDSAAYNLQQQKPPPLLPVTWPPK
eukprot:1153379-Pelagomonas_calceolata.AAC.1